MVDKTFIQENSHWIPDTGDDFLVDFSSVKVLQILDDEIRNIHDGNDTIRGTYFLCQLKENGHYELWLCEDYFIQGTWVKQVCIEKIPIGKSVALRILGDICDVSGELRKFSGDDELLKILEIIKNQKCRDAYLIDLENDLSELACCISIGAYRASLSLCGRILELCIKILLSRKKIEYKKDWMIGKLLSIAQENNFFYCDPALKNIVNIINQQRIIGVHAKERVPIPSKKQALMVLFGVLDTIERTILVNNSE